MKRLLLIIPFVMAFTCSSIGQVTNTKRQIPTIACYGVPQKQLSIARYQEFRASGITQSYDVFTDANAMETALNLAQKAGVKLFVSCPELTVNPEGIVKRFMNHPALAGYYIADEPRVPSFPALASLVKRIRAIDDKHICYINLLPNYATADVLGAISYEDYLNSYINEVPTQIISFDYYPVIGVDNPTLRSEWYSNLEIVAKYAKRAHKPFWAFVLSIAFTPYPSSTLGALRLQAYSNLAYGAQGIQYFTYWAIEDGGRNNFHNSPISIDGKKTDMYGKIQEVNREIKNLSGVFFGAKMISVAHTGNIIPAGCKRLVQLPKPIKWLKTYGVGAVVAVLKKNNESFLVVVNRDFINDMTLTIKCAKGVSRILKDGLSTSQSLSTDILKLGPGDVIIYKWNDKLN